MNDRLKLKKSKKNVLRLTNYYTLITTLKGICVCDRDRELLVLGIDCERRWKESIGDHCWGSVGLLLQLPTSLGLVRSPKTTE